jgi:hypothetical protein
MKLIYWRHWGKCCESILNPYLSFFLQLVAKLFHYPLIAFMWHSKGLRRSEPPFGQRWPGRCSALLLHHPRRRVPNVQMMLRHSVDDTEVESAERLIPSSGHFLCTFYWGLSGTMSGQCLNYRLHKRMQKVLFSSDISLTIMIWNSSVGKDFPPPTSTFGFLWNVVWSRKAMVLNKTVPLIMTSEGLLVCFNYCWFSLNFLYNYKAIDACILNELPPIGSWFQWEPCRGPLLTCPDPSTCCNIAITYFIP